MRLILGPALSFAPAWSRLLFFGLVACIAVFSDDLIGVPWIEWLLLLLCLGLLLIGSNLTISKPTES